MFLSDRHGGMGLEYAQRVGEMRVNFLKFGGIKEEHTHATSGGAVVVATTFSECGTSPDTVMPQIFTMITDVEVEPWAPLKNTGYTAHKFIRVVHRVVVGIVDALGMGGGVFKRGTGGKKRGGLVVVVKERRMAAFIVDE